MIKVTIINYYSSRDNVRKDRVTDEEKKFLLNTMEKDPNTHGMVSKKKRYILSGHVDT